jgi:Metallo-peptidase family M12B Reprolysin-like
MTNNPASVFERLMRLLQGRSSAGNLRPHRAWAHRQESSSLEAQHRCGLARAGIGVIGAALITFLSLPGEPGHRRDVDRSPSLVAPTPASAPTDATAVIGPKRTLRPITAGMRRPAQSADRDMQLAAFSPAGVAFAKPAMPDGKLEDVVIDVIVAYTKAAASGYADIVREVVEPAIEAGNESFQLSGIGHIKLHLVHAYQTNYVESGDQFVHLWRFADKGDGYMDEIHELRDRYRADVAVLIVDDPDGCGQATRVSADEEDAFAVVHHACAKANFSLVHEIGHLLGASHERGYVHGNEWRDIMSYKANCGGCPRLPIWSNPDVLIRGVPAGSAGHDNARVIAENGLRVAAFR